MKRLHGIVFTEAIVLFVGLSPAWSEAKTEKKIEDSLKINWTSIDYTKKVSLHNTDISEGQAREVSERVSLSCEVEILDPNLVLGISRAPVIEQIIGGSGESIGVAPQSSNPFQMRYEAPRYDRRFVPPQRQPGWKTAVRSALRLASKESSRPRWVEQIRPSRMQIDLDVDLSKQAEGKISRVGGHFYALVAESYENVDVPFKPSDKWVRLTRDTEIQLKEAQCTESSFRFNIKARPEGGGSMQPLSVEDYLPNRIVVARQFIGADGKPTDHFRGIRRLPAHISGGGGGSGSNPQIKSVRFVVAVNPEHYEIPFVFENIPLPNP